MEQYIMIIRGLPGSGKTTFANKVKKDNEVVVEADQFHMIDDEYIYRPEMAGRAHEWCQSQVAYFLNQGKSVLVANTFITARTLVPYYEIAKEFNVDFKIKTMDTQYNNIHDVPEDVLNRMGIQWESWKNLTLESFIDYYNEFHDIEYMLGEN